VKRRGRNRWRGVRSTGTAPERRVRAAIEWLNVAYRANASDLPGSPDIAFDELQKVVFVHGCFWHAHSCKASGITGPLAAGDDFWRAKFEANQRRDAEAERGLREMGWDVLTVWECESRNAAALVARLALFICHRAPREAE